VIPFFRFLLLVGLVNALIATFLVCRLPQAHAPMLAGLLVRAVVYVGASTVAGIAGTWWYWHRPASPFHTNAPISFKLFALTSGAGWVWIPAVWVFAGQTSSLAAAGLACLGAALLALGLHKVAPAAVWGMRETARWPVTEEAGLFTASLYTPEQQYEGYLIAALLYLGGLSIFLHENLMAALPLAFSVFVFVWALPVVARRTSQNAESERWASFRFARISVFAVLVTVLALRLDVARRNGAGAGAVMASAANGAAGRDAKAKDKQAKNTFALDGYESIVLWPEPPKKEIVAPHSLLPQDPHLTKPLVIRFNGAYWYFQAPADKPGPHAHVERGSPLAANIHSVTYIPLTMEAHQELASPLKLNCCRAMTVQIENRDNRPGALNVAVLVKDTSLHKKGELYLGQQPVVSSEPGHFATKTAAVTETLRFEIPAKATISKFDEITVVMMSDMSRLDKGARVAVDQFELEPR